MKTNRGRFSHHGAPFPHDRSVAVASLMNSSASRAIQAAAVCGLVAFSVSVAQAAGPTTQFTVSGQVVTPLVVTLPMLQSLPATTLNNVTYITGTTPVTGSFTGVQLWTLLNNVAGLKTNAAVKNDVLREVVLVTGSDGYQAVLSAGELNPSFGGSATAPDLVAYANNGALLTTDGFARTVVPGDIKGGRYVSNLQSIEVIHAPVMTGTFSGGLSTQFRITGNVNAPATFTLATLTALPATTVTNSGVTYTGVALWTLLSNVGVTTNPTIKNDILRDYVVATGTDGYQAVVALGEISPSFGNQQDIVAYAQNGGAPGTSLGANGFAQLIVPGDSKHGRWVSNLMSLEVFDASFWVANKGESVDLTGLAITTQGFHLNGGSLISTGGVGTLTAPTYTLDGGVIAAAANLGSTGAVVQNSGTTILQGGINAPTSIVGGVLALQGGFVNSTVSVGAKGALSGYGRVGATKVAGLLSPGSSTSYGSIGVTGPLVFASTATFAIKVGANASDSVNVLGSAALAGAVQVTPIDAKIGSRSAILTATGGVTGTFASVSSTSPSPAYTPTLTYKANEVDLYLAPNPISPLLPFGASANVQNVARGVDAILLTANAPQQFVNLFNIPTASLPAAMNQLTGEVATGAQTAALSTFGEFLSVLTDPSVRFAENTEAKMAPALAYVESRPQAASQRAVDAAAPRAPVIAPATWSTWAAGFGATGNIDSNAGSASLRYGSAGGAVGADYRVNPGLILGFGMMGGETSYGLGNGLGSGSGQTFQIGAYGSQLIGRAYISGAVGFGANSNTTTRTVALTSFENLRGENNAQTYGGRLETGYRFLLPGGGLAPIGASPYVAIDAKGYHGNAYSETSNVGVPLYGLNIQASNAASVLSELGFRFDATLPVTAGLDVLAFSRLAWAHEFDRSRTANATFEAFSLTAFQVNGVKPAADSALVSLGSEARLTNGVRLIAKADTALAPGQVAVRGTLALKYDW